MIKCPRELNQLENCFFLGLFSTWKISQPTFLEKHRNVCMEHRAELDALQAAVLVLTAAMAFDSLSCVGGVVRGVQQC